MEPRIWRIKASAGAGKTYQLSLRYLKLLKDLEPPCPENLRSIVAITFTNKAAAEMKERILRFLKEIALRTPLGEKLAQETQLSPSKACLWLETIILNYSDFYVRTIDSLLFAILKGLSFELGLKPESKVVFNQQIVLNEAFDLLLARITEDTQKLWEEVLDTYLVIDKWKGFYPEKGLRRRLFKLYSKIKEDIKRKKINPSALEKAQKEAQKAYLAFYKIFEELKPFLNGNKFRKLSKNIEVEELEGRKFLKEELSNLFKKGASIPEEKKELLGEAISILKEKLEALRSLNLEKAYARVGGYVPFLRSLKELSEEICRQEGIILGSDYWTNLVLRALQDKGIPPLIYAHFAARFLHFLFDEFQDTSRLQWETLYPLFEDTLAASGSLFVVGDVKQAIYRWRGGDWNLFDEIINKKYFPSVKAIENKVLSNNFRSSPELINFFNQLFKPLTNKDKVKKIIAPLALGYNTIADIQEEFALNIARSFSDHYQKPALKPTASQGVVRIYEAQGYKEEIQRLIKEKFLQKIRTEWEKRKEYHKTPIAVLVRTNAKGEEISSWLIQEGIPVVTENALRLKVSPVVKGIICFLSYLYEPEDQSALYGFLSSGILPYGPKTEEELAEAWLEGNFEKWKDQVEKLKAKLQPFINRRAPYELISLLMERIGLFERLKKDLCSHRVFVERLLEVTHQFELEEGPSLAKYLSFWETGGLEEKVGLPENLSAVRVLTIHKAKGLEFPVVFIPFTDWNLQDLSPVEIHQGYLVHLKNPLNEELERLRLKLRAQEAQELINLFYVAVTRAEEALYLFLSLSQKKGLKPLSFWIKKLLEESNLACYVQTLTLE